MKLQDYLNQLYQEHKYDNDNPLVVDICDVDTGEVFFIGSIKWLNPNFVNPNFEFISHDAAGSKAYTSDCDTIWFKEVK